MIVRSTIDLAHNLGLTVVAEGVEDEVALDMLIEYGCDSAQGYLLQPAVPGRRAHRVADGVGVRRGRERSRPTPIARRPAASGGSLPRWRRCGSSSPAARATSARRSCACCGDDGHDVVGLDILASPFTDRGRVDRRPRVRARLRARASTRSCTPRRCTSRTSAPTAAPGLRRHQRHRHAEPARGGGRRRRRPLRVHEHDERVRARADPAAGRARGVDHRGRRAGPAQHLRRDQDRRRGPLRARPPRPRPAVPDPAHVALLPGGRRPRRRARALRGREPQGQRAAVPPRRPRGRRRRAPARARARAGDRLRPLHRQRHHAVHARRPRGAARRRARPSCGALFPGYEAIYAAARLAHVPEHRARLRQRAGAQRARLGAALRLRLTCSSRLAGRRGPAQPARPAVGAKGYHAESTGPYTVR